MWQSESNPPVSTIKLSEMDPGAGSVFGLGIFHRIGIAPGTLDIFAIYVGRGDKLSLGQDRLTCGLIEIAVAAAIGHCAGLRTAIRANCESELVTPSAPARKALGG